MLRPTDQIIIGCWIFFVAYWMVNARRVKATTERKSFFSSLAYRLPAVLGAALLWTPGWLHPLAVRVTPRTVVLPALVCVGGLLVCLWARRTLAGNWSSDVTFKQNHELVQSGPYRFVRHPIYTGLLLMVLATPLEYGRLHCWVGLLWFFASFWIKLKQEEKLMLQHFPETYPAYRKKVAALVPFLI